MRDPETHAAIFGVPPPGLTATPLPAHSQQAAGHGRLPIAGWPAKHDLDYTKTLIELVLLLIAAPWIIKRLFHNPRELARAGAKKHAG